jgi:uncharacterized protein YndB with AHSA1/START domain
MSSRGNALPPVRHQVQVRLAPSDAFALFTEQMARWWPFRGHSCFDEDAVDVRFDPCAGGAVTEIARDGRHMAWGTITEWSPPCGFAMRWCPGLDAAEATLLRVSFVPAAGGTEVRIEHGGWEARGAAAVAKREQYDGGWPATLMAYANAAAALQRSAS